MTELEAIRDHRDALANVKDIQEKLIAVLRAQLQATEADLVAERQNLDRVVAGGKELNKLYEQQIDSYKERLASLERELPVWYFFGYVSGLSRGMQ